MESTIFSILFRSTRHEQPNDRMMEWLCDPSQDHGLTDFAGRIITELWQKPFNESVVDVSSQRPLAADCRPDVTVRFDNSLLVIENKVNPASIRPGQMDRQHCHAAEQQVGAALFHVLLCPDRLAATTHGVVSDAFRVLTYGRLADLLLAEAEGVSDPEARTIIRQYAGYVRQTYGVSASRAIRLASSRTIADRENAVQQASRDEFLARVEELRSKPLLDAHAKLLDLLEVADGVEARFDGRGKSMANYKVYVEGTERHILRVFANGRLFAFWFPWVEDNRPHLLEVFRTQFRGRLKSADNRVGSDFTLPLEQSDIDGLVVGLQAVADAAIALDTSAITHPEPGSQPHVSH